MKAPLDKPGKSGKSKDGLSALSDLRQTAAGAAGASPMGRIGRPLSFASRNRTILGICGGFAALLRPLVDGFLLFFTLKTATNHPLIQNS